MSACALLAPNATCILSGDYIVTAADAAAGQIDNTATSASDQTPLIDDDRQVNINTPSHILDKAAPVNTDEDGSTDISVGDTLTYTITATNNSLAILTNLVVSDPMLTPNTNACATVAPNGTCVLTGSYTVTASDVVAGSIPRRLPYQHLYLRWTRLHRLITISMVVVMSVLAMN